MKIVIIISAIAEWIAVKPLFPGVTISHFPFGKNFEATVHMQEGISSVAGGEKSPPLERSSI